MLGLKKNSLGPCGRQDKIKGNFQWIMVHGHGTFLSFSYQGFEGDAFPVLYLSSPTGSPGTFDLHHWAEERGVIIVGINDSKNGQTYPQQEAIQEAVLTTATRRLHAHPHLNFAAGISGGGRSSLALVARRPKQFAGVLLQCMSGSFTKHIAVSWIHGAKDAEVGVGGVWSGYDKLARSGRCTVEVNRSRKHTPGSRDEKEHAMEHMLWWGRLTHPGLSKDEKKEKLLLTQCRNGGFSRN